MSGASFDVDGSGAMLGEAAYPVAVARYDGLLSVTILPNVACEMVSFREGAEAPVAQLRYLLDERARADGYPVDFEDLWPVEAPGPYVLRPDDRVLVLTWTPSGRRIVLFDGFCQVPQVDLTESSQSVTITAVGAATRCWDEPIAGRVQRDGDDPQDTDPASQVSTDLPCRFNPSGQDGRERPNCTPLNYDVNQGSLTKAYPVFLDEHIERSPDPRRYWTLAGAVRYLLGVYNGDQRFVQNPLFSDLDTLLQARTPKANVNGAYDPSDPASYTSSDIVVRDFDATNKAWPDAMGHLLGLSGFGMRFDLATDGNGLPVNSLTIYRRDAATAAAPKDLLLDAAGATLDPTRNTVQRLHLARDLNSVVNAWTVETRVRRVEASFVLAPGFVPAAGDEQAANRNQFLKSQLTAADATVATRRKYRWYVADECGDGHYSGTGWTSGVGAGIALKDLFPPRDDGTNTYVRRMRPGMNQLASRDSANRPRTATLYYSTDYAGPFPAVWDGSGTWKPIPNPQWNVLEDRLGIEIIAEDPEAIHLGGQKNLLKGITAQTGTDPNVKKFYLRLTTVIDDDLMLPAVLGARLASPTQFERRRRIDAHDHFEQLRVHKSSPYFDATKADPGDDAPTWQTVRDDTPKALAHAQALRAAHEFPPLAGSATLPFLSDGIRVGDRIRAIAGRDVSLQVNAGTDQGEGVVYPVVVAVTWHLAGGQSTEYQLADRRAEVGPAK